MGVGEIRKKRNRKEREGGGGMGVEWDGAGG